MNPYESTCTTLTKAISIIDILFEASAPKRFDVALNKASFEHSLTDKDISWKPALEKSPEGNSLTSTSWNSTTKSKWYHVGHSVPKEDAAPKRPIRGLSPPRFISTSYNDGESRDRRQ